MTQASSADIGVTGLAVMGRNLARNLARHGHTVALHNRLRRNAPAAWWTEHGDEGTFVPSESMAEFVASASASRGRSSSWSRPAQPTDDVIDELVPLLDEGDIVIDCGNAHYVDTRRREADAARQGPALRRLRRLRRRGGRAERPVDHARRLGRSPTQKLGPIFESIAAQVDGTPCCVHVGPDGAGHFVKMVHNGIEYADMQLIAEAYDLLRDGPRRTSPRIAEIFRSLERRRPRLVPDRDHRRRARPAGRGNRQRRSSTSCWTRPSRRAPAGGRCRARWTSASRSPASPRPRSPARCPGTPSSAAAARETFGAGVARRSASPTGTPFIEDVRRALYASKVVAYAQGFDQIAAG